MPKEKQPEDMTFQELLAVVQAMDLEPLIELLDKLQYLAPDCEAAKKVIRHLHDLLHEEDYE